MLVPAMPPLCARVPAGAGFRAHRAGRSRYRWWTSASLRLWC